MKRLLLALLLLPSLAHAQASPVTEEQRAQLEALRAEVASQIQLQAYDLLDELVYGWTQQPPFGVETPVVLAGVSVPVGFGSGMQALIESHFASVVVANPRTKVVLSHCPACTSMVVHSMKTATIVARGVDAPEALATAGALSGAKHAVFLDFEAEGSSLVLRARITGLEPALPIVYAKTLSTSTSSPALLRSGMHLKSAEEARQEYFDAIRGLTSYTVPMRISLRAYAQGQQPIAVPPFIWIQGGFEGSFTQARSWTGGISFGVSWAPELHEAFMIQGRLARLVSGPATSLTHPDVYAFVALSAIDIRGVDAVAFRERVQTPGDVIAAQEGDDPHDSFGAFQVGLEARVKNRIAAGIFVETIPAKQDAPSLGQWFNFGVEWHTAGAEVTFCF
jgi:hypothetical protein